MIGKEIAWKPVAVGLVISTLHCASYAIDSASIELASGNKTQMVRVGMQWNWERQWWRSNGSHLSGYWDLTLARWRGDRFQNIDGQRQDITSIGVTPVFRLQKDTLKGFYAEAGVGAHYLSQVYDNNTQQLSTRFQFGDHLGIGYVFQNTLDVGLKFQHFSNGGIKRPNDGVNFAVVRVSYTF